MPSLMANESRKQPFSPETRIEGYGEKDSCNDSSVSQLPPSMKLASST